MKKLAKYLKPYWFWAILSPITMIGEVICDLFQPDLMASIVDDGVLGGDMDLIWSTGIKMLLIVLLGGCLGVASGAFSAYASQSFGRDLRNDAFTRIMNLSPQQTDKFTTGSLVTRMTNDVTLVQDTVNMILRMVVRAPMQFIGSIYMALRLNVKFGLILVVAMPIMLLLITFFLRKINPLFGQVQERLDGVNAVVQENVSGARVVKAYVREDYENERFAKANAKLMDINMKVHKYLAFISPIMNIIMNTTVVAVILIGGIEINDGNMGVGEVMAAITYISQILGSLMFISMIFQSLARAGASARRINEIMDTTPALKSGSYTGKEKEEKSAGSVRFENVTFRYPGQSGRPVLSEISFEAKPGQMVAVLGSTGCGKTTLVNMIPRFYDANQGKIYVDDVPVTEYDLKALRNKVAYVLQKSELFAGTISENIRWGKADATDEEVKFAADVAQASEFIEHFADGYDTMVGEKGASLSGGQKQRMSIARAVLKKPEIMIFDDATSALDLSTEAKLLRGLRENLKDTTVIMIAQRVQSVLSADKILVLDRGRIVAGGTHEELLATSAVYQDIYQSQVKGQSM